MKKLEFQDLVLRKSDIFKGLIVSDATIRTDYPHFSVQIYWKGIIHHSTIHTGRGKCDSTKAKDELSKYKRWANEVVGKT